MRLLTALLSLTVLTPVFAVDMEDVAARVNRMEHRMSALEKQMFNGNTPKGDGSTAFADFEIRLEELERENTTLYGSVEQLGRAVEELARQVKTMNEDIVLRLQDLETGLDAAKKSADAAGAAQEKAAKWAPALEKSKASEVPEDLKPEKLYSTAYKALTNADYAKAKLWFNTLVKRHKEHEQAENAYHWLGEIHMVEGNPTEAVVALKNGLTAFPEGKKAPAYLAKMGEAFVKLDKRHHAKSVWGKLVEDHADSPEAAQIKPQLDALLSDKD